MHMVPEFFKNQKFDCMYTSYTFISHGLIMSMLNVGNF